MLNFACHNLVGLKIDDWIVKTKLPHADGVRSTGGNFSVCYIAENEQNEEFFLKVLDYQTLFALNIHNKDFLSDIDAAAKNFIYEKQLADYCRLKRVPKIVKAIASGHKNIEGYMPICSRVDYIVFEKADGDIRKILTFSSKLDFASRLRQLNDKLKSIHDVSVGLNQLHKAKVSHQDLKPSNVLLFGAESKIGDFGRSLCFEPIIDCPYDMGSYNFWGDLTYAPPEYIFKYWYTSNRDEWFYQIDNYMLGGLIVFYLIGMSINALICTNLAVEDLRCYRQGCKFDDVILDLQNAFQIVLTELYNELPAIRAKDKIIDVIKYLCNPDPKQRGHKKNIASKGHNYNLERIISMLAFIQKQVEKEIIELN
jgi:serine/threonine protein kinase